MARILFPRSQAYLPFVMEPRGRPIEEKRSCNPVFSWHPLRIIHGKSCSSLAPIYLLSCSFLLHRLASPIPFLPPAPCFRPQWLGQAGRASLLVGGTRTSLRPPTHTHTHTPRPPPECSHVPPLPLPSQQ